MTAPVEFSRPFDLDRLGSATQEVALRAGPEECAALAGRLGLAGLQRLEAQLTVEGRPALGLVILRGRLEAEVTQVCVVSLEPFEARIEERFEQRYRLERAQDAEAEESLSPEAPDPLPEEGLDLGEEVAQQLSLALDPYPRRPGAALPDAARDETGSPFADLAAWRRRRDG